MMLPGESWFSTLGMRGVLLGMVMDSLAELKLVAVDLTELHLSSEILWIFLKAIVCMLVLFSLKVNYQYACIYSIIFIH